MSSQSGEYKELLKKRIRKDDNRVDNDLSTDDENWVDELDAQMRDNSGQIDLSILTRRQLVRYVQTLNSEQVKERIITDYDITAVELQHTEPIKFEYLTGVAYIDPELKEYLGIENYNDNSNTLSIPLPVQEYNETGKSAVSEETRKVSPVKVHLIKSSSPAPSQSTNFTLNKSSSPCSTSDKTSSKSSSSEENQTLLKAHQVSPSDNYEKISQEFKFLNVGDQTVNITLENNDDSLNKSVSSKKTSVSSESNDNSLNKSVSSKKKSVSSESNDDSLNKSVSSKKKSVSSESNDNSLNKSVSSKQKSVSSKQSESDNSKESSTSQYTVSENSTKSSSKTSSKDSTETSPEHFRRILRSSLKKLTSTSDKSSGTSLSPTEKFKLSPTFQRVLRSASKKTLPKNNHKGSKSLFKKELKPSPDCSGRVLRSSKMSLSDTTKSSGTLPESKDDNKSVSSQNENQTTENQNEIIVISSGEEEKPAAKSPLSQKSDKSSIKSVPSHSSLKEELKKLYRGYSKSKSLKDDDANEIVSSDEETRSLPESQRCTSSSESSDRDIPDPPVSSQGDIQSSSQSQGVVHSPPSKESFMEALKLLPKTSRSSSKASCTSGNTSSSTSQQDSQTSSSNSSQSVSNTSSDSRYTWSSIENVPITSRLRPRTHNETVKTSSPDSDSSSSSSSSSGSSSSSSSSSENIPLSKVSRVARYTPKSNTSTESEYGSTISLKTSNETSVTSEDTLKYSSPDIEYSFQSAPDNYDNVSMEMDSVLNKRSPYMSLVNLVEDSPANLSDIEIDPMTSESEHAVPDQNDVSENGNLETNKSTTSVLSDWSISKIPESDRLVLFARYLPAYGDPESFAALVPAQEIEKTISLTSLIDMNDDQLFSRCLPQGDGQVLFTFKQSRQDDQISIKSVTSLSDDSGTFERFNTADQIRCPQIFNEDEIMTNSDCTSSVTSIKSTESDKGMALRSGKIKPTKNERNDLSDVLANSFQMLALNPPIEDTSVPLRRSARLQELIKSPEPAYVTLLSGKKMKLRSDNVAKAARSIYKKEKEVVDRKKAKKTPPIKKSIKKGKKEKLMDERALVLNVRSTIGSTLYNFGRDCINAIFLKKRARRPRRVLCGMKCGKVRAYTCTASGVPVCSLSCYKKNMELFNRNLIDQVMRAVSFELVYDDPVQPSTSQVNANLPSTSAQDMPSTSKDHTTEENESS